MHSTTPEVRQHILQAAQRIIASQGASALTIAATAQAAGLSVGGLRYHFASKHELLAALVDALVAGFDQALLQAGPEPGARTRAYLAATLDESGAEFSREAATGLLAAVTVDPELLDQLRAHYARWQALLDDDGLDPAVATTARLAADGWWLAAFLGLAAPTGKRQQAVRQHLDAMVVAATADAHRAR